MLANELTQREFNEWQQFFFEEPFGQRHTDYLISTLTAIVANFMRGEDQDPFIPEDFIPKYGSSDEYDHQLAVEADVAWINAAVEAGTIQRH